MASSDYTPIYKSASQTFNVDPLLIQAVAQVESSENPKAVSPAGARGHMQLMPANLTRLNVPNWDKPEHNIPAGTRMLDEALDAAHGDVTTALRIYQGGTDRSKWGPQNEAYPKLVAAKYQQLKAAQDKAGGGSAPQSDPTDDFLAGKVSPAAPAAAAIPKPKEIDATDDFLTGKKGAEPEAPKPAQPEDAYPIARGPEIDAVMGPGGARAVGVVEDALNSYKPPLTGEASADAQRGQRVIDSVADAYTHSQNPLMTDKLKGVLEQSDFGKTIAVPALDYAGRAIRGGMAVLGAGVPAVIGEVAGKYGLPGRDLNLLAQDAGVSHMPGEPAIAPEAPRYVGGRYAETLSDAAKAPLSKEFKANPLTPEAAEKVGASPSNSLANDTPVPTMTIRPEPAAPRSIAQIQHEDGASLGQAVAAREKEIEASTKGAAPQIAEAAKPAQPEPTVAPGETSPVPYMADRATPHEHAVNDAQAARNATLDHSDPEAGMAPGEADELRKSPEGEKLLERQKPGVRDDKEYIKGNLASTAEIEQTVSHARDMKALNQKYPEVGQEAKEIADDNAGRRDKHYSDMAGTKDDITDVNEANSAKLEKALEPVWDKATPVDTAPIHASIEKVLDGKFGKLPPVQKVMEQVRGSLFDRKGNPETDPQQLWGSRRVVDFFMSKEGKAENPAYGSADVQRALKQVKGAIDDQLTSSAPGFHKAIADYAEGKKASDRMEVLQEAQPSLYDAGNKMTYSKVQTFMKKVVKERKKDVSKFKALTDEDMQNLWNLRDDLRRSASAMELAKAAGSDSVQNAWDHVRNSVGAAVEKGALAGGHFIAGKLLPGLGNAAVEKLNEFRKVGKSNRAMKKDIARGKAMIRGAALDKKGNPLASGGSNPLNP